MKKNKKRRTLYECFFKRFFDITLSLLALIVLSPIFLFVFIASKVSIGGKVLFSQYRPGKNGRVFKLYKFRSMTNELDKNGQLLPDEKRITKFGKFLRKTSLDELPQLINILKGDMSIIGPRPRLVKDIIFYNKEGLKALSVRPGLTGPSQVSGGRSGSSWEKIIQDDTEYAQRITFWKDLKIFFKTIIVLLKAEDGSAEGTSTSTREYYYCNHLLKTKQISQLQYDFGVSLAEKIIATKGKVEFTKELHSLSENT